MFELFLCALGSAATLLAEHLLLWRSPWRLHRLAAYSVGTATLALWFLLWSILIGVPGAGIAFILLATPSGAVIVIAYWLRGVLAQLARRDRRAGQISANPLSQERIDKGLRP